MVGVVMLGMGKGKGKEKEAGGREKEFVVILF